MLKSTKVSEHMSTDLVILDPEMDILRAVHKLIKNNISGAPVVNATTFSMSPRHLSMAGFTVTR
jgi:CBS domain-containing protein